MEHRVKCRASGVAKKWSRLLLCDLQPYKPYLPDCDMSLDNGLFKILELPNLGWFSLWTGMRTANLQWRSCDRRGKNYLKYSNTLIKFDFKYLSPTCRHITGDDKHGRGACFRRRVPGICKGRHFITKCFGHLTKSEIHSMSTGSAVQWWGPFGLRRWKDTNWSIFLDTLFIFILNNRWIWRRNRHLLMNIVLCV